jgi:hypothetical protein
VKTINGMTKFYPVLASRDLTGKLNETTKDNRITCPLIAFRT